MSEKRTVSILRRLPVILAVTAASYGLAAPGPQAARLGTSLGAKSPGGAPASSSGSARASQAVG